MNLMMRIADISHCRHYFFKPVCFLCSIENAKFGPILANYDYFVANLRTFGVFLQA